MSRLRGGLGGGGFSLKNVYRNSFFIKVLENLLHFFAQIVLLGKK